ncbi:MAG: branched-chain amino acid transporter ATP-binding protein/permease, partial [Frankiales bacterium]|nr:branched-chain amino acid transporter ATP-binding protein/permease [Frankiales bacterium]
TDASFVRLAIYGALLVLLMAFRPSGLFPEFRRTTRIARGPTGGAASTRAGDRPGPAGRTPVPRQPSSGSTTLQRAPARAAATASGGADDSSRAQSRAVAAPAAATTAVAADAPATGILTVTGLHKSFGGIKAVQGVDLVLPAGEVTALIGPNGAGKSTIFGLITGFIAPDKGDVRLRGQDILGKSPQEISRLGMVRSFQDVRLFRRMTVLENAMFGVPGNVGVRLGTLLVNPVAADRAERRARDTAMEALETVGLADKADLVAGGLGHGEQKLAAIARILATGAEVMLLDEPTSGVDPRWVERVAETIRGLPQLGKTVCIVEHNLGFLEQIGAPCYFLEAGVVRKKGTLRDLMADAELRQAYFGV